jgi:hypothetical protein
MRGAGRSERTIHDGLLTLQHLERYLQRQTRGPDVRDALERYAGGQSGG